MYSMIYMMDFVLQRQFSSVVLTGSHYQEDCNEHAVR